MIDYEKSAELNGMVVDELKVYFDKYPKSSKKVVRICDGCGEKRELYFHSYHDLCKKCTYNKPEYRLLKSKIAIQHHIDNPETRNKMSVSIKSYWDSHVEEKSKRFGHLKGENNPAKRLDVRKKIIEANTGRTQTRKAIENMRKSHKTKEYFVKMGGSNNPSWKGGISLGKYCYKFNFDFKEIIRNRFNRLCFLCGMTEEENMRKHNVHHVNYDKDCLCNSSCEFVPLCDKCHGKTGSKYKRQYWEDLIMCHLYPDRIIMVD